MTDNEKILTWLGYRLIEDDSWVNREADVYTRVITTNRERLFLPGKYPADPRLDYLVLEKVRTVLCSQRWAFEAALDCLWQSRIDITAHAEPFDAMVIGYRPGDYAEAARQLWEKA